MNMIASFNSVMDYIETVLDGEPDEKHIACLSGYSYPLFSRLFSILTEMPLSEYIRCRRLTEAALLLRSTDRKVIDIALMFGYESPDSFAAAFKSFHGFTPSEVRRGKGFRLVSRLQLSLSVQGGRSMVISIQKKGAFSAAGIDRQNISSAQCPSVWENLFSKYSHETMAGLGEGQSVGICHDIKDTGAINYMAGYIVTDKDRAQKMGLKLIEIEAAEYAVVELRGPVPECIHRGWKYAMEVFMPEHGYMHSGSPDFEYYCEGDMSDPDYRMELWIPIVKGVQDK